MMRKLGLIIPILVCGWASVGAAQDWGPEDDDGYEQYRAEPDRRSPPRVQPPKQAEPLPKTERPQVQVRPLDVRPPTGANPLEPNQPHAPQPNLAQPSRPPLASDPGILSDQIEREPPPQAYNDPTPDAPPSDAVPRGHWQQNLPQTRPHYVPPPKARIYIPLEPAVPPATPPSMPDQAFIPPPSPPTGYYPLPGYYPPPVHTPPRVYGYPPPRYYTPPRQYAQRPFAYDMRPSYPAEIYIYSQRGWRR